MNVIYKLDETKVNSDLIRTSAKKLVWQSSKLAPFVGTTEFVIAGRLLLRIGDNHHRQAKHSGRASTVEHNGTFMSR